MERFGGTLRHADRRSRTSSKSSKLLSVESPSRRFWSRAAEARAYAIRRFSQHLDRLDWLAESLEEGQPDANAARAWDTQDKVFADIDYRWLRTNRGINAVRNE